MTTEAGVDDRLALQYWFFYPFNDYTNKHEGDWEMVQLVFAAADATQALDQTPLEVGYSQHEGLEVAEWDDPKLEIVDGTHPVVHAAAGSHANYYDDALYLGTSGEQGFGCDDTRGPADDVTSHRRRHPRRPGGRTSRVPVDRLPGTLGPARGVVLQRADRPEHQGELDPPDQLPGGEGSRRQLRRSGRWPLRHLRHRLLLQHRLQRVGGRPQARGQPRAPAPDPGR